VWTPLNLSDKEADDPLAVQKGPLAVTENPDKN
jgi:hypothetical protein